jgi:hypothetical protein
MGAQQSAEDGPLDPEALFGKGSYLNDGGDGPVDPAKIFGSCSDQEMLNDAELKRYGSMSKGDFRQEALQRISSLAEMKDTIPAVLHSSNTDIQRADVKIELTRYELKVFNSETQEIMVVVPFTFLHEMAWDHSESRIRIGFTDQKESIFNAADGEAKVKQILFVLENSLATEAHLMEQMKILFLLPSAPKVRHLGVISGTEDAPFARKGVRLSEVAHQPTQQEMKHIIQEHQASQAFGLRRQLALQHIHHGYNAIPVTVGRSNGHLVFDGEGFRVFEGGSSKTAKDFNSATPLVQSLYSKVHSWGVDGETFAIVLAGDGEQAGTLLPQKYRTPAALVAKNTLDFFCNQKLRTMGMSSVEGSTHGRKVQAREKLELVSQRLWL